MAYRRLLAPAGGALALLGGGAALFSSTSALARDSSTQSIVLNDVLPTRSEQLVKLRDATLKTPLDVLVIGGGATGTGTALDSQTRGLRTALIEREDFASGTSSKSTKLVHGGVRYLEKAVFNLDYSQLKLVFEALKERGHLLDNACHLSNPLAILTPCYKWWEVPYYWAGMKAYDLVAGRATLVMSSFIPASESLQRLPTLAETRGDGDTLKGAIIYYDGQFDDARLAITLATTAAAAGAACANYVECKSLIKDDKGQVIGAQLQDQLSGESLDVYAKVVINATGVFTDAMRKLSDDANTQITLPSSGAHITLPDFYGAGDLGLLVPKTPDGRVVFVLPWLDHIIAGTTDQKCDVTPRPAPTEAEVQFILETVSQYLNIPVRREDVKSAWSGIRPLAVDPKCKDTSSTSRDHVVVKEDDGMITVVGGKWTTYRLMAEDTMRMAMESGKLPKTAAKCNTEHLKLLGSEKFEPSLAAQVVQAYTGHASVVMDTKVGQHMARAYGDRAMRLLKMADERKLGGRLVAGHPYLEAEVVWAVQHEYCETIEDFVSRRSRLAFLDVAATQAAVPRVAELMAKELSWSSERLASELTNVNTYLKTFMAIQPDGVSAAHASQ